MFSRIPTSLFVVLLGIFTVLFPGLTARYAAPASSSAPVAAAPATSAVSPAAVEASSDSGGQPESTTQSARHECEGRFVGPVQRLFALSPLIEPPPAWLLHTRALDSEQSTTTLEPGNPAAVALSTSASTMAWIGRDGVVWFTGVDGAGGARRHRIDGAVAKSVALSPNGDALAALDEGGTAWVWQPVDTDAPESFACARQGSGPASALAMSSRLLACASPDRGVYVYDYASTQARAPVRLSTEAMGPLRSLVFSPSETTLALVGANGAPSIWGVDGDQRHPVRVALDRRYDAGPPAFSPDENALVFAGADGSLWRWNARDSGAAPRRLADDAAAPGMVSFAPGDGTRIAYSSKAGATVLDGASPRRTVATGRVLGLQFDSDGRLRVAALPVAETHDPRFVDAARALAAASRPRSAAVRFLVATVPDPIDSGQYDQADQIIESLARGIESSGPWLRDRFWLPWKDLRPRPAGERQPSEQCRAQVPGMVLFRASDSSSPGALVLLLVGETPTWGVHKSALMEALDFVEASSRDAPRRGPYALAPFDLIGPTFSGSAVSIRSTLEAWTAAREPRRSACFTFLSGNATADINRKVLDTCGGDFEPSADCADTCGAGAPPYMEYHATVLPDSDSTRQFMKYLLAGAGAKCDQIAVLKESGTQYTAAPDVAAPDDACRNLLTMHFPLHISAVRRAYDAAAQAGDAPPGSTAAQPSGMNLNPTLDEPADPLDVPPSLSPRTPFMNDLIISSMMRELSRRDIRFVGLQASDPSDVVFLAQQLRARMPDARLYVFGADLLYTHPKFTPALEGAYVVSSYPLFLPGQSWMPVPLTDIEAFASDAGEGAFNAARAFLDRDVDGKARKALLDYFTEENGAKQVPSTWVSLVGLGGLWPLARLEPAGSGQDYAFDASKAPARVDDRFHTVLQPSPSPPVGWWLALAAGAVLCAAHVCSQIRALRGARESVFELVPFREPVHAFLRPRHHAHASACSVALLAAAVPICAVASVVASGTIVRTAAWLVTFAVFVLAVVHAWRAGRSAIEALPAVGWCLVTLVATFALTSPPTGTNQTAWGALVCARLSDLGSGLSPLLPLVFLTVALYVWHASQVARIRERDAVEGLRLRTIFGAQDEYLGKLEDDVRDALGRGAPSPAVGVALVAIGLAVAVFSAYPPSSVESTFLVDVAFSLALVAAVAGIAVAVASLLVYWKRLERLLTRLSRDPMAGAFDRLPKPFVRSLEDQIAGAPLNFRDLHTTLRHLELLEVNRSGSGLCEPLLTKLDVPWAEFQADERRRAQRENVEPESFGAVVGPLLEQAETLRRYLSRVWAKRSLASAALALKDAAGNALVDPIGSASVPTTLALTNPRISPASELWLRLAEEFVASVVTLVVYHLVRHFRILLTTVTSAVLLLMMAVSSYPLQPRRELMTAVWMLTLAGAAAAAYTLVALERNDLLSRIGKTEPGKVSFDRTFLTGLFMWALIPILGLIAIQYPELAGRIFSVLAPASGKSS